MLCHSIPVLLLGTSKNLALQGCHSERSEESSEKNEEILRYAQDDTKGKQGF
jgi:hypothetical protein